MENNIEIFTTSDTKTSAYLLTCDVPLIKLIKDNPRKIIFGFQQTSEVKKFLQDYWTNKAKVNPRKLFDNLDYLKDLIHRDYDL